MAFGNFVANMGYAAQGATDMRSKLNANREQDQLAQMRADQRAAQEASIGNARAAAKVMQQGAEWNDGMGGVNGYEIGGAPATPPVAPAVTGTPEQKTTPAPRAFQADVRNSDNEIAKLEALRKGGATQPQQDRSAALGVVKKGVAAAADVGTLPFRYGGAAVGRVGNAIVGEEILKTDPGGLTPVYDKLVRKPERAAVGASVSRENPAASPDAKAWMAGQKNNPVAPVNPQAPLNVRNNNPGNLRVPGQMEFQQFPSVEAGWQAMAKQLQLYQSRDGLSTLNQIISKWAPAGDGANNPAQYAATVARAVGVSPDQPLNLSDPNTLNRVMVAMANVEGKNSFTPPGAQPAPAGQPAAPQQAAPAQPPKQYAIPQFNPQQESFYATQRRQQYNQAMQLLQTINPAAPGGLEMIIQARAQIDQLKLAEFSAGVMRLATAASGGDLGALSRLAEVYRRETGHNIQLVRDGNQIVAVDAQGQPAFAGTPDQLAARFYGEVDQGIKAKNLAMAEAARLEYLKARGKAAGEHPYKMELESLRGANAINEIDMRTNGRLMEALALRQLTKDDVEAFKIDEATGRVWIQPKTGEVFYIDPPPQKVAANR